jgi:hypothetical protein
MSSKYCIQLGLYLTFNVTTSSILKQTRNYYILYKSYIKICLWPNFNDKIAEQHVKTKKSSFFSKLVKVLSTINHIPINKNLIIHSLQTTNKNTVNSYIRMKKWNISELAMTTLCIWTCLLKLFLYNCQTAEDFQYEHEWWALADNVIYPKVYIVKLIWILFMPSATQ